MELEGYEIKIEAKQALPEFEFDGIIRVERINERKAIIFARDDIREQISDYLSKKDITLINLEIEEPSLEDVFLKTIYKKEG